MILKSHVFTHDEDNVSLAVGIPQDVVTLSREKILFAHFSNALKSFELYEDPNDAPKNITTMTGALQSTLTLVSDPIEYEWTLFNFLKYSDLAREAISYYRAEQKGTLTKEEQLHFTIHKLVSHLSGARDNTSVNNESLLHRINVVKQSKHSFNRYMDLMGFSNLLFKDVNDLLDGAFKED